MQLRWCFIQTFCYRLNYLEVVVEVYLYNIHSRVVVRKAPCNRVALKVVQIRKVQDALELDTGPSGLQIEELLLDTPRSVETLFGWHMTRITTSNLSKTQIISFI